MVRMLAPWMLGMSARWIWLSLRLSMVGDPAGVRGQVPPSTNAPSPGPSPPSPLTPSPNTPSPVVTSTRSPPPLTPSPNTPSPVTSSTRAPPPLTPSPNTPSPVTSLPSTVAPSPLTPSPQIPSTTTRPPPPHPEDDTRFYLIEVRVPLSDMLSPLASGDYLARRVKDIVSVFFSVSSGKYSGLRIVQMYKVVGESVLLAVVKSDSSTVTRGISSLHKLGEKLSGLGVNSSVVPLTSFEAFARALGVGVIATQPSSSSSSSSLHISDRIHCYVLEFIPGATSSASSSVSQLRRVVSFILQERRAGTKLDAYKVLAKTNVEFFICANTVLSKFDRMFLDLWTATNQPEVTSIKSVREVQSADMYLYPGRGGNDCSGFWCSFW